MSLRQCGAAGLVLLLVGGLVGCGGPYWTARGNDAKDMVDFGITTSSKPCFAFYLPGDYFNLTPLGYNNLEGTFHGVGARRVGSMPIRDGSWGLLLWGSKKIQIGEFDPDEPRHIAPSRVAELRAAGKPLPTEVERYNDGVVRLLCMDHAPPPAFWFT
jgi:hypothetical protein